MKNLTRNNMEQWQADAIKDLKIFALELSNANMFRDFVHTNIPAEIKHACSANDLTGELMQKLVDTVSFVYLEAMIGASIQCWSDKSVINYVDRVMNHGRIFEAMVVKSLSAMAPVINFIAGYERDKKRLLEKKHDLTWDIELLNSNGLSTEELDSQLCYNFDTYEEYERELQQTVVDLDNLEISSEYNIKFGWYEKVGMHAEYGFTSHVINQEIAEILVYGNRIVLEENEGRKTFRFEKELSNAIWNTKTGDVFYTLLGNLEDLFVEFELPNTHKKFIQLR